MQEKGKQQHVTIAAAIIPQPASAQLAEVIALTKALEYADSAYAHGAVHVDGPQWMRRGFLTTANTPVKHKERLIKAILLPN